MKKQKRVLICLIILIFVSIPLGFHPISNINMKNSIDFPQDNQCFNQITDLPHLSSQKSNYEIIEEVFANLCTQYSSQGYFSQVYEPSLQATYYALYILDVIGMLNEINQTAVIEYIMSQYDDTNHFFADHYSDRYLNNYRYYYPLTTLLEVNCYAILSLEILNRLDLLDLQITIDYLWSCYNPITSGFIGRPYEASLQVPFNISTLDNTFFAIITLDSLMTDWLGFSEEINAIIQFINSLQVTGSTDWGYGAFLNDPSSSFRSLFMPFEPIFATYYAIKSLQVFGMQNSINLNILNQYLESLYYPNDHQFRLGEYDSALNLVSSAIGLELSDLSSLLTVDRINVANFILSSRNTIGNWDQAIAISGDIIYREQHELIDTFQIIRCLKETGDINQLTVTDKEQIAHSLDLYQNQGGYSLLSRDYMSTDLMFSVINSFSLFNKIADLDIQELYDVIEGSFYDTPMEDCFVQTANKEGELISSFRSYPIEYNGYPKLYYSHKSTYLALNSLQKLFMLDDFALNTNLMPFITNIIDSQFLDPEFDTFGAFLPQSMLAKFAPEYQDNSIHLIYSYYAIKALELLVDYMDLGNIVDLSFNKGALYGYLTRNIYEVNDMIYFNPHGESDPAILLEHNYYMIYILKALDLFDLDRNNITSFILQNIDYGNIKNIYYCYKIDDILDLDIEFNLSLTSSLVGDIYSEIDNGFYESMGQDMINQDIFLWICEMARNDNIYIQCNYKKLVNLGSVNTITAYFSNLIFLEYGDLTSVRFNCEHFGILDLEKQFDNSYQINFRVPEDPKYYPSVEGTLEIYDHFKVIGRFPISFQTTFEQKIECLPIPKKESVEIYINISRKFSSDFEAVYNSNIIVDIRYKNNYLTSRNFSREDFDDFSRFSFIFECVLEGEYKFEITLYDEFYPQGLFLFDFDTESGTQPPPQPGRKGEVYNWILALIGSLMNVIMLIVVSKGIRWLTGKPNRSEGREDVKKTNSKTQKEERHMNNEPKQDPFWGWD
ncbi:MAG: hypothetical protein ACFFCI_04585 [Promethearchaeota archaeon]